MKIYKTQEEVNRDIKGNKLTINGDVKFECSISICASIQVISGDIKARNINAWNIDAGNINAWNIDAGNIDAGDINAQDINARNILYYAFCSVYNSIKCTSIKAKRNTHQKPTCLDGELIIKEKEDDATKEAIELLKDKGFRIVKN